MLSYLLVFLHTSFSILSTPIPPFAQGLSHDFFPILVNLVFEIPRAAIIIYSLMPTTVFLLNKYLLTETDLSSDMEYIGFLMQIVLLM